MDTNEIRLEAQDLNQQGILLMEAGNLEAAQAKFDKAIELDPMLMDSYKNYGDLYMTTEQYQKAKNAYKKALLIKKSGLLHFLYGNACFMNDEQHEGLESYNLAVSEGYDNDQMMFFMGMAYEHMNDDNMALRFFQKACIKNPSRPDYLIKKISVLIRLNMIDTAEEETEKLLTTAPEMFDGYHIKTQLLMFRKEYEKAIAFAKSASEKFPEDADLMYDYAKATTMSKDLDGALKIIESAKKMKYYADSKRAFVILEGQIYAEKGDFDNAIQSCNECIAMETEEHFDSQARFMLMNLYLSTPDFSKALDQAAEIIKKEEKDLYYYAALYYRPFCMKQLGQEEQAKKFYKEANSMYRLATLKNPAAIDIYLYRAMCLKDMEEYDKALEMLDFICGLDDKIAEVHTLKADVYRAMGRKGQAEEELKKAYEIKPELKPEDESVGE